MANFTAADIKTLREQTGAGMLDVKKALDEADVADRAHGGAGEAEPLPTTGSEPEADDTAKHSGAEILVAEAEKAEKADENADEKTEEAAQA